MHENTYLENIMMKFMSKYENKGHLKKLFPVKNQLTTIALPY